MRPTPSSAPSRLALALATTLGAAAAAEETGPIPWRDPAPLARLFLQPAFEAAERLQRGRCGFDARVMEVNNLLVGGSPMARLDVEVDEETTDTRLQLRCGVGAGFDVAVEVPILVDWGGFMDQAIGAVERLVAAENPRRTERLPFHAFYRLARPGGGAIRHVGSGAAIGDVTAAAGWQFLGAHREGNGLVMALRVAIKAPSGPPGFGSGELDVGASLLAAYHLARVHFRLQLDALVPTGRLGVVDVPLGPYAAGQLGVSVTATRFLTLDLQGSLHSSALRATRLITFTWPTWYVLLGSSWTVSPDVELQLAAVENVFSFQRGADFTLLAGLRWVPRLRGY